MALPILAQTVEGILYVYPAVHAVPRLTTEECIRSLKRFIARSDHPDKFIPRMGRLLSPQPNSWIVKQNVV
jgi:hypothetical protein